MIKDYLTSKEVCEEHSEQFMSALQTRLIALYNLAVEYEHTK